LGFAQSVTEAYQIQLRLSSEPRFVLRAEGVETLEYIRSRSERRSARALQPDVIIGWPDWNKVQPFVMSGWAASGQTPLGATAPATKWHLRMNRKGGPPMYLNVELDPMRQRSTITHEAAVRIGRRYESSYMLLQGQRMARSETSWRWEPTPWFERTGGDQRTLRTRDPTS
jgi:hypothetical protein